MRSAKDRHSEEVWLRLRTGQATSPKRQLRHTLAK